MLILRKTWSNCFWAILKFNKIQFSFSYLLSNPRPYKLIYLSMRHSSSSDYISMLKSSNLDLEMEPKEFEKTLNVPKLSLDRPWSGGQQLSWRNYESHFKNVRPSLPFFFIDALILDLYQDTGISWKLQATLLSLLGFLEMTLSEQH